LPKIAWNTGWPKSIQIGWVAGRPHCPAYGAGAAARELAADAGPSAMSAAQKTDGSSSFFTSEPDPDP
jgi:hypothetical protein